MKSGGISTEYASLSAANKGMVRKTIRQAYANGMSDADVLMLARVSAHSGIDVVVSRKRCFVDVVDKNGNAVTEELNGFYDIKTGKMYINPKAKQSASDTVAHEAFHAIIAKLGKTKATERIFKVARDVVPDEVRKDIKRVYSDQKDFVITEEIGAHATLYLNNEAFVTSLVTEKPSLKKTIIDFFKGARTSYAKDGRLSRAARKYLKMYSKLFAEMSGVNAQGQSLEIKMPSARTDGEIRASLLDALSLLGEYDSDRIRHIESTGKDRVVRDYAQIAEFISNSKTNPPFERIHIGIIGDATATLVKNKTGIDINGYDFVLSSNFIFHIYDSHGNEASETPRGQKAINDSNIENIIETIISPDDVSLVSDSGGTALRFEKILDGRNIAITITSTKKSTLTLKSAWIINQNSGGRTPSANANALAGTPKTNSRSSTTVSIPETPPKVNPSDEISSKKSSDRRESRVLKDSDGNTLTAKQSEYFRDSVVRDADGNLLVVYHGTGAEFNEFLHSKIGQTGSAEGRGFYFTDNKSFAEKFQKNGVPLKVGYLNITKPLSDSNKTLTRAEVRRLLNALDPTGDDILINYESTGGVGYPSAAWRARALNDTLSALMEYNATDSELLAEIANAGAGNEKVMTTVRELLGYDGYVVTDKYKGTQIFVAFESNQFKNKTNLAPTKSRDIRYSRSLDTYTQEQYNNYGWARANDILNAGQNSDYISKFARAVKGDKSFRKTDSGEWMIPVSDIYDDVYDGIDNVIVFAKGTIDSPEITRVLHIDLYNETDLSKIRSEIYEAERQGIRAKTAGIFKVYYPTDYGYQSYNQRSSSQKIGYNNGLGINGGTGGRKATRLKEIYFDENGRVIYEIRASRPLSEAVGEIATSAIAADLTGPRSLGTRIKEGAIERVQELSTMPLSAQIQFVNEQAGIENAAVKMGVERNKIESAVQMVRNSAAQAQYLMAGKQFNLFTDDARLMPVAGGKSLTEIMEQILEADRDGFQMYLYHAHNVDRMSLEAKSEERLNALIAERDAILARVRELDARLAAETDPEVKRDLRAQRKEANKAYNRVKFAVDTFEKTENKPVLAKTVDGVKVAITAEESARARALRE